MHSQASKFVRGIVAKHELNEEGADICEIGSVDVNGSVRPYFAACASYTGVDVRDGKGVDIVADGGYWGSAGTYDVVVTTECLEHAESPKRIVSNAARILKPGGALIITAAGPGRGPHSNDGTGLRDGDTYQNIAPDDLAAWLADAGFERVTITHNTRDCDVYACAFKPTSEQGGDE